MRLSQQENFMRATNILVDHCRSVSFRKLPDSAITAAKTQLLDCIACGLAGMDSPGVRELIELNRSWGGAPESAVFGHDFSLPCPNAAQVNVTLMHARDYDDVHANGFVHPGIISVGTALAVADLVGDVSGRELLAAVAMGTDLISRLGMAVETDQPRSLTGWHFTSVFGYLASAAVAGRLMRLNTEQMTNALGIAYHQSAGNGQCVLDGALTKRLGPGFAVKGGITAAILASKGLTGAAGWLEGEMGLYQQYFGKPGNLHVLLSGLGSRFEGSNVAPKRYGCCGLLHPFIDAALHMVRQHPVMHREIEEIKVYHGEGARFMIEPIEAKRNPRNAVDSQFSIPWAVSVALVSGRVSLEHFSESGIADEATNAVSSKVVPILDPDMTRIEGNEDGRVDLKLIDGRLLSATCVSPLNEDSGHMNFAECVDKFNDCLEFSSLSVSPEAGEQVLGAIRILEELPCFSLKDIFSCRFMAA